MMHGETKIKFHVTFRPTYATHNSASANRTSAICCYYRNTSTL